MSVNAGENIELYLKRVYRPEVSKSRAHKGHYGSVKKPSKQNVS